MTFLEGESLSRAIRDVVAAGPVDMAVAFWGNEAVERLDMPTKLETYRIVCDGESGSCSPTALRELLVRGARITTLSGMHAKLYRGSNQMVVGSANASSNGLSEEPDALGLEVGMLVLDRQAISDAGVWFDSTFEAGRELRTQDLPEIEERWRARRQSRPLRSTLADALLANAPSLKRRRARAYLYSAAVPSPETEAHFKASPAYDPVTWERDGRPFFWGEQPEVSAEDELVCFEVRRGKVRADGVWRINQMLPSGPEPIWPAKKIDRLCGMPIGDMQGVVQRLSEALTAGRLSLNGPPIEFAAFTAALAVGAKS